ncbi:hypothetical protein HanRHA438_Chr03g0101701 [Helianthus annuus]|nr:hypothetical protein HanRHA438_Chr03g0101701 [Helianthus annuus]
MHDDRFRDRARGRHRPAKPMEKTTHASSGRASAATSASEPAQVAVSNNVGASNLNSASPPFYPSGSTKDAQSGSLNRGPRPPVMVENYRISQSNVSRGRNVSVSLGMDKLHIDDSISKPRVPQVAYQPVSS